MMQMNRLFEIVYLLMEKKTMTAQALAAHFEVSGRTILRDIDILSGAGIPVYTSQGRGGGISLLDGYVLNRTVLTDEEQSSILLALQSLSPARHIETESVARKLKSIFVKQNTDWIEVDFSRWGNTQEDKSKFELIKSALLNKQALCFTYYNAGGQTGKRKVYPLKLIFKSMSWYLSAYCTEKKDYRVFKLTRLREPSLTGESFGDMEFAAPDVSRRENKQNSICLKLLVPPELAYRVYDGFDETSVAVRDDGFFIVTAVFPDGDWILQYILSFGPDVQVLEPPEVREKLIETAERIIERNRRT